MMSAAWPSFTAAWYSPSAATIFARRSRSASASFAIARCMFDLGEFLNIVLMSAMLSILFFGGWLPPLNIMPFTLVPGIIWMLLKIVFFFFCFAMVRAFVPRYRYDQLMRLGWKVFLPISLLWVVVAAGWVMVFHHGGM